MAAGRSATVDGGRQQMFAAVVAVPQSTQRLDLASWLVDANRDADRWGALADGTRRAIVACLAEGPQAVGQLAAGLPVSRSAVSQHLKILKDAGLVEDTAAGTRRIYRLNPVALAAVRDQLDTYWQRALAGYAEAAEAADEEG
jgi:DNA-binding transcriptional ArsR family regulator